MILLREPHMIRKSFLGECRKVAKGFKFIKRSTITLSIIKVKKKLKGYTKSKGASFTVWPVECVLFGTFLVTQQYQDANKVL